MADSTIITTAGLRDRLAATRLPADPTDVVLPPGSERWPPRMREQLTKSLTPAGVLVPLIERAADELSVLLTQRSADLKHHAGQVSFPGGRMEAADADIAATALRETHEEVGIERESVSVIGYLEPMPTITGYAVTPIVGIVDAAIVIEVDKTEVEYAFEVPLAFLLDRDNRRLVEREVHGSVAKMVEFHYEGHRIWGATAFIIMQFIKTIKNI
ncbi:MAG: CoA pyrophosphatase [Gammaproteobacteria bacterium]|nr:CoA pyrophosphatase [Gammaproteobacteria bacterium]